VRVVRGGGDFQSQGFPFYTNLEPYWTLSVKKNKEKKGRRRKKLSKMLFFIILFFSLLFSGSFRQDGCLTAPQPITGDPT
jgi:hypothetical protein